MCLYAFAISRWLDDHGRRFTRVSRIEHPKIKYLSIKTVAYECVYIYTQYIQSYIYIYIHNTFSLKYD